MNEYTKNLVEEHAQLVARIDKLEEEVYMADNNADTFSKVEYANQAIQLASMKKYAEALEARLENRGIYYEDRQYLERVAVSIPKNNPIKNKNEDN